MLTDLKRNLLMKVNLKLLSRRFFLINFNLFRTYNKGNNTNNEIDCVKCGFFNNFT